MPLHVLTIRARLAAKARSVGGQRNREPGRIQDFIAIEIRHRNFGGGNQPEIFVAMRHAEKIGGKLRQLSRAIHGIGVNHVGRENFRVSVLAGVQIEHEVGESTLQARAQIPVHCKARPGEFGGAL